MSVTTSITSEQFLAAPDEYDNNGNLIKQELIGGEIVFVPPPSQRHDLIKVNIVKILMAYVEAHSELNFRVLVEMAMEMGERNVFVPDLGLIESSRIRLKETGWLSEAPEMVCEVVSPSETDARTRFKVTAYLDRGVKVVWLVYPRDRSMVVHTPQAIRAIKADQMVEDPLLAGFSVPLSDFFKDV
jgi:Uma2 family endonuclease